MQTCNQHVTNTEKAMPHSAGQESAIKGWAKSEKTMPESSGQE